jgi:hypothetical protein
MKAPGLRRYSCHLDSNREAKAMTLKTFLKSAVLGAGAVILVAGLAIAQSAPAPAPAAPAATPPAATATPPAAAPPAAKPMSNADRREARHKLRATCRDKARDMRGSERRDTMRKCMSEGRAEAGLFSKRERRAHLKGIREACRAELKDQRFTEAERRTAMQDCAVKKDPGLAKSVACMKDAEAKKLERGTREFRTFLRACNTAR